MSLLTSATLTRATFFSAVILLVLCLLADACGSRASAVTLSMATRLLCFLSKRLCEDLLLAAMKIFVFQSGVKLARKALRIVCMSFLLMLSLSGVLSPYFRWARIVFFVVSDPMLFGLMIRLLIKGTPYLLRLAFWISGEWFWNSKGHILSKLVLLTSIVVHGYKAFQHVYGELAMTPMFPKRAAVHATSMSFLYYIAQYYVQMMVEYDHFDGISSTSTEIQTDKPDRIPYL